MSADGLRLGGPERVFRRGDRGRRGGDREREGDLSKRRDRGDGGLRAGESGDLPSRLLSVSAGQVGHDRKLTRRHLQLELRCVLLRHSLDYLDHEQALELPPAMTDEAVRWDCNQDSRDDRFVCGATRDRQHSEARSVWVTSYSYLVETATGINALADEAAMV